VLSYYGSITVKNELWIMMDVCVGSLKDMMKICVETLDEAQISLVSQGVLKGLSYLHQNQIVHMDIKAANILLTEDGLVKLADFGVSQQLRASTTQSDLLIGSPLYIAPEIILKSPYDIKADTWSFGITLIELAEGRVPNRGMKNIEDINSVPHLPPPTLANARLWTSTFLEFIAKCLNKAPAERPSATDLLSHPFIENAKGPEVMLGLIKDSMRIKEVRRQKEQTPH